MECTDESLEKVKKNQRIIIIVFFILFLLCLCSGMLFLHIDNCLAQQNRELRIGIKFMFECISLICPGIFLLLLSMVSIHSSGAPAGVLIGVIFTVLGLIAMIIICMFRIPETVMEDGIIRKDYSFLALERYEYYEADTWYSLRNITDEYEMK